MFENRVRWQIETTNVQIFIWNPGIYFVNDNINHRLTPIYTYYTVPVCIRTLQRKEGCQQSFLSLLRERALCALYLYRSLDIKVTSLHNWVESVTNLEQDIVIKMNTETQNIRDEVHWFFTLLKMETGLLMEDLWQW